MNKGFYFDRSKMNRQPKVAKASGYAYRWWSSYSNKKRINIVEKLFESAYNQQLDVLEDFDSLKRWVWQQLLDGGAFRGGTIPLKKYRTSADEFWSGYYGRNYNQDELAALKAKWQAYQDNKATTAGTSTGWLGLGGSSSSTSGDSLIDWMLIGVGVLIVGFLGIKLIKRK